MASFECESAHGNVVTPPISTFGLSCKSSPKTMPIEADSYVGDGQLEKESAPRRTSLKGDEWSSSRHAILGDRSWARIQSPGLSVIERLNGSE